MVYNTYWGPLPKEKFQICHKLYIPIILVDIYNDRITPEQTVTVLKAGNNTTTALLTIMLQYSVTIYDDYRFNDIKICKKLP